MDTFSLAIELLGVVAFAISGAMVAIRRKTDLFGVLLLSIITAFGGGLTRDVVFSISPPAVFSNKHQLIICLLVALLVFLCAKTFKKFYLENETKIEQINDIFDSLGLGAFAVIGVKVAIQNGFSDDGLIAVTCGVITGICGGMLRDVLTNSMPFVLVKRVYAVAAIAGTLTYYIMFTMGINDNIAIVAGTLVTFILRILARTFKWNIPKAIE